LSALIQGLLSSAQWPALNSLQEAQAFEFLNNSINRISRVFGLSTTSDYQFAGTKQKNHDFRI
jgi:hypothetical protein